MCKYKFRVYYRLAENDLRGTPCSGDFDAKKGLQESLLDPVFKLQPISLHRMTYNLYDYRTTTSDCQNFESKKIFDKLKKNPISLKIFETFFSFLESSGMCVLEHIKMNRYL